MNSTEKVDWLSERMDLKQEGQRVENGLSEDIYVWLNGIHPLQPLKQNKKQNWEK